MNSRTTESLHRQSPRTALLLVSLAVIVIVAGCARKPWREPLAEEGHRFVLQAMDEMRQVEAEGSTCLDTDVNIYFTSHVKNRAISGYMQLMQPSFIKFISSNPLGQPIFAFVSDGENAQLVSTFERFFAEGSVADFADLYDIPSALASSSGWGKWLTGRLPAATTITAIRQDESHKGVWVSIADEKPKVPGKAAQPVYEHLLVDTAKKLLLGRIITDSNGKIEARISYSDWLPATQGNAALQPGMIMVTELDYGGELVLKFSALQAMESCNEQDFTLRRPPGYRYEPISVSTH